MKKVTIDFTGAKYYGEVHQIIKDSFKFSDVEGFPDFYGENADALWDCLTGFIETPVEIIIKGTTKVSEELQSYLKQQLLVVFNRAMEEECWEIYVKIID